MAAWIVRGFRALSYNVAGVWMDFVLIFCFLASLLLLKQFLENPNLGAFGFLVGSVLLSLVVLMFKQYKNTLKTAKVVGFIEWFVEDFQKQRKMIGLAAGILLMIYAIGMLIVHQRDRGIYLLVAVIAAATVHLAYNPKKDLMEIAKFYAGMVAMSAGLMLVFSLISLTELFFGSRVFVIDAVFGVGLLLVVYLNEKTLGLSSLSSTKNEL